MRNYTKSIEAQELIHFENVGLRYGKDKEILKDVNFKINKGDFYFLIGESGAGKSSFLNLINASLKPSRGFLSIFGEDANKINSYLLSNIRRRIGIIFQNFKLINHLSIFDNIALPLKIIGETDEEIKERTFAMLHWLNLEDYKNATPLMLSGGEQQRVAVARSVINNPDIILADEPTGSIDNKMSKKILYMLEDLNEQGVTIIFATHNLSLVESSNHKIALIKDKKLTIIKKENIKSD